MDRRRTILTGVLTGVTVGVLTLTLVGSALSGCARARERWDLRLNPPEPEPVGLLTPDETARADRGLEIAVWTADDTGFRVGRVLAEMTTPATPGDEHDAWARAGMRVLAVPADRVDELLRRTPPVGAVQRQRYAQLPNWTPLVRGPRLPAGVTGPDGRALATGRPRLIARAWSEPDLSSGTLGAVIRTELTIQIETGRKDFGRIENGGIENSGVGGFSPDPSGRRTIGWDGPIVESLLTALVGDGSTAFVIVAESPSIDWNDLPALAAVPGPDDRTNPAAPPGPNPMDGTASPTPPGTVGTAGAPAVGSGPGDGSDRFGPVVTGERTLGERMLASPGIRSVGGRPAIGPRKVLMVLMPRPSEGIAAPQISPQATPRGNSTPEEPS